MVQLDWTIANVDGGSYKPGDVFQLRDEHGYPMLHEYNKQIRPGRRSPISTSYAVFNSNFVWLAWARKKHENEDQSKLLFIDIEEHVDWFASNLAHLEKVDEKDNYTLRFRQVSPGKEGQLVSWSKTQVHDVTIIMDENRKCVAKYDAQTNGLTLPEH